MIVDIVLVVLVAVCVILGIKRGLILSLFSALSLVIAIIAGCLLMPPLSAAIRQTGFPEKTEEKIYTFIEEKTDVFAKEDTTVSYGGVLERLHLPEFLTKKLTQDAVGSPEDISREIAKDVTQCAVKVLSFLIVAVAVGIGLTVVRFLWKGLRELPLVRKADTLGGLLFGLAHGILIVCTLMLLLCFVSSSGSAAGLIARVQDSTIGAFFYEKNFLGIILAHFIG